MTKQKKRIERGWAIKKQIGSFLRDSPWDTEIYLYIRKKDAVLSCDKENGEIAVKVEIREL